MAKKKKFTSSSLRVQGKTENQTKLIRLIDKNPVILCTGLAGTGKTFVTASKACEFLKEGKVSKIILTRPNVPCGRSIGFYPGTLEEKMAPWVAPVMEIFNLYFNKSEIEMFIKNGTVEVVPLEVIRGRSFNDSFVILDEAQNLTTQEMKAFLTRIGEGSTVVINGDIKQKDIKEDSGLSLALLLCNLYKVEGMSSVEFKIEDVVRSSVVKNILIALDEMENLSLPPL